jgi:Flp pilus assembly protein protease CpaA
VPLSDYMINLISVLVVLAFLGYGSVWSDIKTREVPNIVWLLFAPIGTALTVARLYFSPELRAEFLSAQSSLQQLLLFYFSTPVSSVEQTPKV